LISGLGLIVYLAAIYLHPAFTEVQSLMFRWFDLDDLAGLEALAKTVLGKV